MPLPTPMPLDVKLMNTFSVILGLAFAAMLVALGVAWLMRQSLFSLSAIRVQGDLEEVHVVYDAL